MIGYFNTYIAKYYDTPKKKSYTFLGFSLTLVIIFIVFAIRPTFSTVIELRQKLKEGQAANKKLDEKITSLSAAQETHGKIEDDISLLSAAVPENKKLVDFLNKVNLLGAEKELLQETLEYKKGAETVATTEGESTVGNEQIGIEPLEFTVSGKGDYEKIKEFVGKLENMSRLVDVKSAEVERKEGEEKLEFTVVGRVYWSRN